MGTHWLCAMLRTINHLYAHCLVGVVEVLEKQHSYIAIQREFCHVPF